MNKKDTIWRNNKLHGWFNISPWETIACQWTTFNVSCIQRNDDLLAIFTRHVIYIHMFGESITIRSCFIFYAIQQIGHFFFPSFNLHLDSTIYREDWCIVCSQVYICLHSIMIHCVQWCEIRRLCCRGAYVSCGQDCQVVQMFVFHGRHQVIHGAFGFISFDMIFLHPEHLAGAL